MRFSLTMFPVGNGPSVRKPVAKVVEILDRAGLHYEVNDGGNRIHEAVEDVERELHHVVRH